MNKILNPSQFWSFNTDLIFGQWSWPPMECTEDQFEYYLYKYFQIAKKNGILVPLSMLLPGAVEPVDFFKMVNEIGTSNSYGLQPFYRGSCYNNIGYLGRRHYSVLYINNGSIQSFVPLADMESLNQNEEYEEDHEYREAPVGILDSNYKDRLRLPATIIALQTDVFFPSIFYRSNAHQRVINIEADDSPWINGKKEIDNHESALVNTPRLNSFIGELTRLNHFFGRQVIAEMTDPRVSEHGVLYDADLLFYEDVFDLLRPEQRYHSVLPDLIEINENDFKRFKLETNRLWSALIV